MLEAPGDPAPATKPRRGRRAAEGRRSGRGLPRRRALLRAPRRRARSSATSTRAGSTTSCAGLEAAFVDIGLEKNGFLHVDEIVLPGVEAGQARPRQRRRAAITDLLKPGQEIVVQVVKDPLKTKGARLSMELTIAGRYMVYAPDGEGVGVSRRLDGQGARPAAQGGRASSTSAAAARSSAPRPTAPSATDFERELQYLFKLNEVLAEARRGDDRAGDGLPGGRPVGARRARHLLRATFERAIVDDPKQHHRLVSFFTRTAPELVDRVELYEERRAAVRGATASSKVIEGDARRAASTCPAAAT